MLNKKKKDTTSSSVFPLGYALFDKLSQLIWVPINQSINFDSSIITIIY